MTDKYFSTRDYNMDFYDMDDYNPEARRRLRARHAARSPRSPTSSPNILVPPPILTGDNYEDIDGKDNSNITYRTLPIPVHLKTYPSPGKRPRIDTQRISSITQWLRKRFLEFIDKNSVIIICMCLLVLIILGICYITKPSKPIEVFDESGVEYTLCSKLAEESAMVPPGHGCIREERLQTVLQFIKKLPQLLKDRYCADRTRPPVMGLNDLLPIFYKQRNPIGRYILQEAAYMIDHNPQWQLIVVDNQPPHIGVERDIYFALANPELPIACPVSMHDKLERFFKIVGWIAVVVVTSLAIYFTFDYIKCKRIQRGIDVQQFRSHIIDALKHRAKIAPNNCEIIVHHLRDELIPMTDRSQLLWSWNEALRLLEANDSRVQFGLIIRNGEEFRTMKWIGEQKAPEREPSIN